MGLSKRIFTGLQPRRLGTLITELAGAWTAAGEARLLGRQGHERMRAPGSGPDHDLPFTDRVIITLVYLHPSSRTPRSPSSTGWTGPPSPGRFAR